MAERKRKFYLTLFWSDESVMREDFRNKVSGRMVEWANNFYGNYGFELDVFPDLTRGRVPLAHQFYLRKTDGIRPDPDFDRKGAEEDQKREEAPFNNAMERLEIEIKNLRNEEDAIRDAMTPLFEKRKVLERAYDDETDLGARQAIHEKTRALNHQIDALYDQLGVLTEQSMIKNDELIKARGKIREIQAKYNQIRENARSEVPLRIALGLKHLNEKLMTKDRLCVVFCRFVSRLLTMRGSGNKTLGQTYLFTPDLTESGYFLWPRPFIIIDINMLSPITLAHEMVHAAGMGHPDPLKVVKSLEYLKFRPERAEGSMINRIVTEYKNNLKLRPLMQEVLGGFFDGPPNSIMNYNTLIDSSGGVILTDENKAGFESAFFLEKLPAP